MGPYELKNDTVSMSAKELCEETPSSSPTEFVAGNRVSPEEDDPTASTFLAMAGLPIVHVVLSRSPSFPAAKINRCSGFFRRWLLGWETASRAGEGDREDDAGTVNDKFAKQQRRGFRQRTTDEIKAAFVEKLWGAPTTGQAQVVRSWTSHLYEKTTKTLGVRGRPRRSCTNAKHFQVHGVLNIGDA